MVQPDGIRANGLARAKAARLQTLAASFDQSGDRPILPEARGADTDVSDRCLADRRPLLSLSLARLVSPISRWSFCVRRGTSGLLCRGPFTADPLVGEDLSGGDVGGHLARRLRCLVGGLGHEPREARASSLVAESGAPSPSED
jgi:hypothetical protein